MHEKTEDYHFTNTNNGLERTCRQYISKIIKSDNFAKLGAHRKPCNLNSLLYLAELIRIWDRTNISLVDDYIFLHVSC